MKIYDDVSPVKSNFNNVVSVASPIAFSGVALMLSIHFQLAIILKVFVPICTGMVTLLIIIGYELSKSNSQLQCTNKIINSLQKDSLKQNRELEHLKHNLDNLNTKVTGALPTALPAGMFELYIDYKSLEIRHFIDILGSLEGIYFLLYGVINEVYEYENQEKEETCENLIEKILRANSQDRLVIEAISSTESVKLRAKTGWLPAISHRSGPYPSTTPL